MVIPFQYSSGRSFQNGTAVVEQGKQKALIDTSGTILVPFADASPEQEKRIEEAQIIAGGTMIPDWADAYYSVKTLKKNNNYYIVQESESPASDKLIECLKNHDLEGYFELQPRFGLADAEGNWIIPLGDYVI